MTDQEFYLSVGYLASPERKTNIEVEMPEGRQPKFILQYAYWTNNYPLPLQTDTAPYYVWKEGANKYGLEIRAYFVSNSNMPDCLEELLEPRKSRIVLVTRIGKEELVKIIILFNYYKRVLF